MTESTMSVPPSYGGFDPAPGPGWDYRELACVTPDFGSDWPEDVRRRRIGRDHERAVGAILGMAVGDALGAPYEFGPSPGIKLAGDAGDMVGGGALGWAPGEWTDDTSMAVPMLRALATTPPLEWRTMADGIVREWRDWAATAKDVGAQTRQVLALLPPPPAAADARAAALQVHRLNGRSGGNGSLMRTAPVGVMVAFSAANFFSSGRSVVRLVNWAREFSELTHWDPEAGDACALWSCLIFQATTFGVASAADALACVPRERRDVWAARLEEASYSVPGDYPQNGWVVHALQAAWAALHRAGIDLADDATATPLAFRVAVQHAINAGNDTDTVAAITGALAGAFCGADAIPDAWKDMLHGWGGVNADGSGRTLRAGDLEKLALAARKNVGGDLPFVPPEL